METWNEITMRHYRERIDLVESLNLQGLTQTEAAKKLEISLSNLNNIVYRNGIDWRVRKQGVKSQ